MNETSGRVTVSLQSDIKAQGVPLGCPKATCACLIKWLLTFPL